MLRRLLPTAALAAGLLLPATPAAAYEPGIVQSANFASNEAELTQSMGAKWVRLFAIRSNGCLPAHEVARLDSYKAAGVKVLVAAIDSNSSGITIPSTQDYANFVACLAGTYGDRISAIEIWNEPDEHAFWPGGPNPAAYTALLKAAHGAIKAANPGMTVVIGGLTGNNFSFLEQLYAAGAKGHFDAVGVHTDTACLVREPEFHYREPDGRIGRFSFTGYREVRHVMEANGDPKPIWMTEIGWSTLTSKCTHPGVTEDRPSGVSQDLQADYLKRAYACVAAEPYIGPVFWFSQRDAGTSSRYDHHLGLMDFNGNPKKAFHAFRDAFRAGGAPPAPNPGCGGKLDKDAPSVTISAPARYFSRFAVEGRASDPTTPVSRIELWVDGKRVEGANQSGDTYKLDWFGSTKLPYGAHTVELRAYDEAQNVGRSAMEVVRVDPKTASAAAARTATARLSFKAKRLRGGRVRIDARVLRALTGEFTEKPKGRLRIFFERKVGKKWKPTSRFTKGISKRIRFTYKAKKRGTWRVWARLAVDAPYKNARTKQHRFRL